LELGLKLLIVDPSLLIPFGTQFFLQRREAIQEQLADVSQSDGIESLDAFTG
jgi:hypothetical protein